MKYKERVAKTGPDKRQEKEQGQHFTVTCGCQDHITKRLRDKKTKRLKGSKTKRLED